MMKEDDFNGVIYIHGKPAEIRIEPLVQLTTIKPHFRDMTLVYKHYLYPDDFISPVVVLPGKHFEYADPIYLHGTRKENRYILEAMLLSESDKESEWLSKGIRDKRGRVWFVDP